MMHRICCRYFLLFCLFLFYAPLIDAAEVKVVNREGDWVLLVDARPFSIKGVGCGLAKGKKGEDFLKMARDLGANCVRTWGTDQGSRTYLDTAWKNGLRVDAGIWLNWADPDKGVSYIGETLYKKNKREEVLSYIREFKDHPAILMWNIGNEALFFTQSEEEKVALAKFLEEIIQEAHRIDPNHPVVATSAAHQDLPYLKKYVPSLDIVGMNVYCRISIVHAAWESLNFGKPYVITEFGPYLSSDTPEDINGKPQEPGDILKASTYRDRWQQIQDYRSANLGGFVFHLGETSQESMTWWNINQGEGKRQSYWVIYEAFTGKPAPYAAPKIKRLVLSKVNHIKKGEFLTAQVELGADGTGDYSYEYGVSTATVNVLKYYVNQYIDTTVLGKGKSVRIKAPLKSGIYRVYCFVKDKFGNVSSLNKSISVEE